MDFHRSANTKALCHSYGSKSASAETTEQTHTNAGGNHAWPRARETTPAASLLEACRPLELLGLLCSGAGLATIVALLKHYDRQPLPEWNIISLNTLISWLSTFAKACVLMPVTVAISQLKWVWFSEKRRPMSQLQVFDAASRGVIGSGHLLWALKMAWSHLASVGCIVTILAIGFEPFLQNLIHYYPQSVVDQSSPAYVANTYLYRAHSPGNKFGRKNIYVDPLLKANVYNALFNTDESQPWAIPKFSCATGNCSWTDVTTFLVRPSCHDLTHQLATSCNNSTSKCSVGVKDGPSLTYSTEVSDSKNATFEGLGTWVKIDLGALADNETGLPYLPEIQYVMLVGGPESFTDPRIKHPVNESSSFVATSCALELCTQQVDISVNSSIYSEVQKRIYCDQFYADTASRNSNITLRSKWNLSDTGGLAGLAIDPFSYSTTAIFLTDLFAGYVSTTTKEVASTDVQDWRSQVYDVHPESISRQANNPYAVADTIEAIWYGNISRCTPQDDHLTCAFTNLAKAMTKSWRDSAFTSSIIGSSHTTAGLDNGSFGKLAVGMTYVVATFVRIDWWWILLPCLIWIVSAILWLGTVLKTRSAAVPNWGDNILPLLILPRRSQDDAAVLWNGNVSKRSLRQRAKQALVKLHVQSDKVYLG